MKTGDAARRWLVVGAGTIAALVALLSGVLFLPQKLQEWTEQPSNRQLPETRIVQLRFARAPSIAKAIRLEFSIPEDLEEAKPGTPFVVTHRKTNSILLQAPPDEFATLHQRIQDLDISGPAKRTSR